MDTMKLSFRFLFPYRRQMALSLLISFLSSAMNVGLLATSGLLIAKAALHPETILLIWVPIVAVRTFGLSRAVFRYLDRYLSHDVTFHALKDMRVWMYRRVEPLVPQLWDHTQVADVQTRLTEDVDSLQVFYVRALSPVVTAVLIGVSLALFCGLWSPVLASSVVGLYALAAFSLPLFSYAFGRAHGQAFVRGRAAFRVLMTQLLRGLGDVIMLGRATEALAQLQQRQQQLARNQGRLARIAALGEVGPLMAQGLAVAVTLVMGTALVNDGRMSGVDLPMLVLAVMAAFEPLASLGEAYRELGICQEAVRRLTVLTTQERPEVKSIAGPPHSDLTRIDHGESGALAIRDLCVRYESGQPLILDGLDLQVRPGEHVALVGVSGCGKSTLVRTLLGLWPSERGTILVSGHDVKDTTSELGYPHMAVLEQHPHLFHASIEENLRLGDLTYTEDELWAALDESQLAEQVRAFPRGLGTLVGELGARLSGGEGQRLALARTLLRKAPILILDEPTASLDEQTERAFLETMWSSTRGRTVIWVTHRLAEITEVDKIAVMARGKIIEQGTHAQLQSMKGHYWALWAAGQEVGAGVIA